MHVVETTAKVLWVIGILAPGPLGRPLQIRCDIVERGLDPRLAVRSDVMTNRRCSSASKRWCVVSSISEAVWRYSISLWDIR